MSVFSGKIFDRESGRRRQCGCSWLRGDWDLVSDEAIIRRLIAAAHIHVLPTQRSMPSVRKMSAHVGRGGLLAEDLSNGQSRWPRAFLVSEEGTMGGKNALVACQDEKSGRRRWRDAGGIHYGDARPFALAGGVVGFSCSRGVVQGKRLGGGF